MHEESIESQIRERLAADDPSVLGLVWTHYASDLLALLASMLCSPQDAEDVLQEIFVKLVHKRHQVAKARALRSYLFRMARNEAINFIKRRRWRRTLSAEQEAWLVADGEANVQKELAERLTRALEALPEKQRTIVVLKTFRVRTFRDIAQMLGISENTAASRYRYGIDKLRTLIGSDES